MTKYEALKLAMDWYGSGNQDPDEFERLILSIVAQRGQDGECKHCTDGCPACDARKLPEQEPLEYWNAVEGWVKIDEVREHFDSVGCGTIYKTAGEGREPLYTTPPQRKPLTVEQPEVRTGNCLRVGVCASEGHKIQPQRTWVGLTDEEKKSFWTADQMTQEEWDELFTAIEANLKEKNT
jgi:hypothetical protein